jgi:hypothetical protein
VDDMDKPRLPTPPTGEQKQKKRTFGVLTKRFNSLSTRKQPYGCCVLRGRSDKLTLRVGGGLGP